MGELTKVRSIEIDSIHCNCLFFLTGTVLFSSESGSGGGAIELIAENGILTVGKRFRMIRIKIFDSETVFFFNLLAYSNDLQQ